MRNIKERDVNFFSGIGEEQLALTKLRHGSLEAANCPIPESCWRNSLDLLYDTTMAHDYPLSPVDALKRQFLGRRLADLPTPSLILDRSLLRKNCTAMLDVCSKLGVGFRAHVKSHKTLELAEMQVGDGLHRRRVPVPAKFLVSTVAEAENLRGFVNGVRRQGRGGNVCCFL